MEAEIKKIEEELSNPSLYTESPEKFDSLTQRLVFLKNEIDNAEMQWLELQDL